MRWVLIIPVLLYRRLAPARLRARCLFRETCSAHVLRRAREGGFAAGCAALVARLRQCRPGYQVMPAADGVGWRVRLADGSDLHEGAAATEVIAPAREAVDRARAAWDAASAAH
jgi:putative component of membrane protein insertase Oxa1/YidC/SpoIIIJ protein YidD